MSNYNTGNPVPSTDPRDLDDNATVFDLLLNGSGASYPDRTGVNRKSWTQMEIDASALVAPNVSALAAVTPAVDTGVFFNATVPVTMSTYTLTSFSRTLGTATDEITFRTAVGAAALNEPLVTIASAATADIGAATSASISVTGTTTITALGIIAAGVRRQVRFTGALTLTHNPGSLILPAGVNILTAAGDVAEFRSLGSGNWACTDYQRASGQPVTNNEIAATIASASTTDIGAATTNVIDVTGTVTITALGTAPAGARRQVRFTGALTLTYNASSLILPGSANILTAADDIAEFRSLGSGNWECTNYSRRDGQPLRSDIAWTNFTLQNSWAVIASRRAAYRKVLGQVQIELQISGGTATDGTVVATLPVGFRPAFLFVIPVAGAPNATPAIGTSGPRILINTDGTITCTNCTSAQGISVALLMPLN